MPGLRDELVVLRSRMRISAAESQAHARSARKSQPGLSPLLSSGVLPSAGALAPDLTMGAVAALASAHHGWAGSARWRAEEQRAVQECLDATRGDGDAALLTARIQASECGGRAMLC